jgi:hypothetical protein
LEPALSDLLLFGYLKSKLPGLMIRRREDVLPEIGRIFHEISTEALISISASRKKKFKWVTMNGGNTSMGNEKNPFLISI